MPGLIWLLLSERQGLTALQLIRDVVNARKGMTILRSMARQADVGSFAAQIARHLGAKVIGTASDQDVSYLKSLGVEQVIDYKRERFEEKARELDAVVDLVGAATRSPAPTRWSIKAECSRPRFNR